MNLGKKLVMPNHIVVKDGLACGDNVVLAYDFQDGKMLFNISSEGCECCKNVCNYIQEHFYNEDTNTIERFCNQIMSDDLFCEEIMKKIVYGKYNSRRKECCVAPIRILQECVQDKLGEDNNSQIDLYVDKMDCDACATRENVSWLYVKPKHTHGDYKIEPEKKKLLMRLGRINVEDMEYERVKKLYLSLSEDDFVFMEEYKLFPMVYHNLKKMGVLDIHDERWRLLLYQRQRTLMAQNEINLIQQYIQSNELKAYWIKGAYTRNLYSDLSVRNLTDFDLLVTDEKDAFTLIRWLLNNDFRIFPDSFSLKQVEQNNINTYTGHLHFQKIINMQFRLIVDINFTGFPMMRVASYKPLIDGSKIAIESMLVVTLCHFFKHKEVFLKDMNDFYLMLMNPDIRVDVLIDEIKKNELERLFMILLDTICMEYNIAGDIRQITELREKLSHAKQQVNSNWIYEQSEVNKLKEREFALFANDKLESKRLYLYPTVIFKENIEVDFGLEKIREVIDVDFFEPLTEGMKRIGVNSIFFVISPIGIFLEMKEYYAENMKKEIREYLMRIIKKVECECVDIPYAIAFTDKWLDTEKE